MKQKIASSIQYQLTILVVLALMHLSGTPIETTQIKDKVYAVFIMNFARNIEWPKEKKSGNFIIGVVNYPPVATQLKSVATQLKNIHNHPITVKEFSSASDAEFCHIVFIPESDDT